MIELSQWDGAVEQLAATVAMHPRTPYSSEAIAHFYLGVAYERMGKRESANDSFNRAIAIAPADDPANIRSRARERMRRR
jgi:Flp pilus assembly protein TadD